jgi:hypothetical protein
LQARKRSALAILVLVPVLLRYAPPFAVRTAQMQFIIIKQRLLHCDKSHSLYLVKIYLIYPAKVPLHRVKVVISRAKAPFPYQGSP